MIKLIYRKHFNQGPRGKIVIYYSFWEIILGLLLLALALFFAFNYLQANNVTLSKACNSSFKAQPVP